MSPKLKCHPKQEYHKSEISQNWNATQMEMSQKLKCHTNGNGIFFTKTEMAKKFKYHKKINEKFKYLTNLNWTK